MRFRWNRQALDCFFKQHERSLDGLIYDHKARMLLRFEHHWRHRRMRRVLRRNRHLESDFNR